MQQKVQRAAQSCWQKVMAVQATTLLMVTSFLVSVLASAWMMRQLGTQQGFQAAHSLMAAHCRSRSSSSSCSRDSTASFVVSSLSQRQDQECSQHHMLPGGRSHTRRRLLRLLLLPAMVAGMG